uniref:Uncharacterized protein n=1 Tax=Ditylenchus dipsaci TaxID=166011 RepID=A0A915DF12_9BILA
MEAECEELLFGFSTAIVLWTAAADGFIEIVVDEPILNKCPIRANPQQQCPSSGNPPAPPPGILRNSSSSANLTNPSFNRPLTDLEKQQIMDLRKIVPDLAMWTMPTSSAGCAPRKAVLMRLLMV